MGTCAASTATEAVATNDVINDIKNGDKDLKLVDDERIMRETITWYPRKLTVTTVDTMMRSMSAIAEMTASTAVPIADMIAPYVGWVEHVVHETSSPVKAYHCDPRS